MTDKLLIGEGSSFDSDSGTVHDFRAVDFLLNLLFVVVRDVRKDYGCQEQKQCNIGKLHTCYYNYRLQPYKYQIYPQNELKFYIFSIWTFFPLLNDVLDSINTIKGYWCYQLIIIMIPQARKSYNGNPDSTRPSILEQFKITPEPRSSDLFAGRDDSKTRQNIHNSLILSKGPRQSTPFKKVVKIKRDTSPATSAVTSLAQDYYKQMQSSLMSENSNLKDHNSYLVSQIKLLFEREKKYKKALLLSRQKIDKLENLNEHLNKQLHVLTNSIVAEIQRMQKLIELDLSHIEDEMRASGKSELPKSLECIGWQTQSTLNHNLEELKQRVHSIYRSNFGQPQTIFHYRQGKVNAESPKRQSRRESNISGETFVINSIQQSVSREEQFKNYLPINSAIEEIDGRSVKARLTKH